MTKAQARLFAGCCLVLSAPAYSLEKLSDDQLSEVQAQGANWTFENIEFLGEQGPNGEAAGFIRSEGTDGSSLTLDQLQFSATSIGTRTSPLTTGSVLASGVDGIDDQEYLRIGLPELAAWDNVDLSFEAIYGNPTERDESNRNILAGGEPSNNLNFGRVTLDDLRLAGYVDIAGIPDGYKIESNTIDDSEDPVLFDGSIGAPSRQGMLLNVHIDELAISRLLFESEGDGVFDDDRDFVINNFSIKNLNLDSATIETTPFGWRFAYSDPLDFAPGFVETPLTPGESGHPIGTIPDARKASISFETQMAHGLASESRIEGFTVDHLVFNMSNGNAPN